jgi:hypothetical protein
MKKMRITLALFETKCRASMDKALARTASWRSWIRDTDFERLNTTGQWYNAAVCAPSAIERQAAHRNPTAMGYASEGPSQREAPVRSHVCRALP